MKCCVTKPEAIPWHAWMQCNRLWLDRAWILEMKFFSAGHRLDQLKFEECSNETASKTCPCDVSMTIQCLNTLTLRHRPVFLFYLFGSSRLLIPMKQTVNWWSIATSKCKQLLQQKWNSNAEIRGWFPLCQDKQKQKRLQIKFLTTPTLQTVGILSRQPCKLSYLFCKNSLG